MPRDHKEYRYQREKAKPTLVFFEYPDGIALHAVMLFFTALLDAVLFQCYIDGIGVGFLEERVIFWTGKSYGCWMATFPFNT